ncbi:MAG: hypothetical protein ACP5D6_06315 [Kosmotogaceae bacterium]
MTEELKEKLKSITEKLYEREKPLTKVTEMGVDSLTLEKAKNHYSGGMINVENPKESRAKVFLFGNKFFTCTGVIYYGQGLEEVEIREVVGKEHYDGPERDPWVRGTDYYLGGEVNYNGQRYVMTENEIRLIPKEVITQKTLF